MSFAELAVLLLICLLAWFWFDSIKARELGIAAARAACEREGVQLLDDTVSGSSLRLGRDENGRVAIRRAYEFEYSGSGYDRFRGAIVLLGREVVMLDVAGHRNNVHKLY